MENSVAPSDADTDILLGAYCTPGLYSRGEAEEPFVL